ncbi:dATP/dGTP diphosphohydrolase domain-containing protein [Oceanihabitans sediminis]|uniref:dATP/dGTP diphosphohydrolase domain-containing protein n=1 Tax=Oceanihabitans sediminis TaxID=1812012 RepID=UPI00299D51C2|nr:dATP/dGTP diphosphohydrolase domain-containing protein [Oceanihabitans sediminis]MDX1279384.1 dATP/dGTP diphosphohydrolase domain-containing protein [Oceanihabitans sediminis]
MGDKKSRYFDTGATRDTDEGKLDYEGFISPLVLERFAQYMNKHRYQSDGNIRDSDNWQKGIPQTAYMKSGWRHFMDWWKEHRGIKSKEGIEEALCAVIFNASGYLFEILKEKNVSK